jgi:hypothetical protein
MPCASLCRRVRCSKQQVKCTPYYAADSAPRFFRCGIHASPELTKERPMARVTRARCWSRWRNRRPAARSRCKRLCQDGHPTVFLSANFLFEEIQAAKAAGRYLNYVRSLIKAKVLILDDLDLRNYTHEEATSLMDILEERYHKATLIVTSQVEPQGWIKLFEDPVIGEAIVDRLIHPCQKITLKGDKSYREKLSEKKTSLKN